MRRSPLKGLPITPLEFDLIEQIVDRAFFLFPDREATDIRMDIQATILGGCKLRLYDLVHAEQVDFIHDIVGIESHLDHQTFELKDCFVPRYAIGGKGE
jgi:hypothetical protein